MSVGKRTLRYYQCDGSENVKFLKSSLVFSDSLSGNS